MIHKEGRSLLAILLLVLLASPLCTIDATPTEFEWRDTFPDPALVRQLAKLSSLMYHITSVDDSSVPSDMISELFIETDRGTEALVGSWQVEEDEGREEFVFVAFRGTEEDADWDTNGQIALRHFGTHDRPLPSSDSPVRVHRGFNDACLTGNIYRQVNDTVTRLLEDRGLLPAGQPAGEPPTVYVTGHSLGGVDALVMSSYMACTNPHVNFQMISFGAPQLGNAAFKSWTENELDNLAAWRFVNRDDIVPRLLPLLGHAGHLMWMLDGGIKGYYRQDGGGDYAAVPSSWGLALSISDHKMKSYIDYLDFCVQHPDMYYPSDFEQTCTKSWWEFWKSC